MVEFVDVLVLVLCGRGDDIYADYYFSRTLVEVICARLKIEIMVRFNIWM
jgi:hypothetical protein